MQPDSRTMINTNSQREWHAHICPSNEDFEGLRNMALVKSDYPALNIQLISFTLSSETKPAVALIILAGRKELYFPDQFKPGPVASAATLVWSRKGIISMDIIL